jgi:hypothetical protein
MVTAIILFYKINDIYQTSLYPSPPWHIAVISQVLKNLNEETHN